MKAASFTHDLCADTRRANLVREFIMPRGLTTEVKAKESDGLLRKAIAVVSAEQWAS